MIAKKRERDMIISDSYRELPGFSDVKAAEVAAFFAGKAGSIDKLKLIKLIYLADRKAMEELGRPILNDEHFSLKNGPICSFALDGINGHRAPAIWEQWVRKSGNTITPAERSGADFDEVSVRETRILDAVWERFGPMTTTDVWKWTHDHCPEYEEVTSGCRPISYERIFTAVGAADPAERANDVTSSRVVARAFPG